MNKNIVILFVLFISNLFILEGKSTPQKRIKQIEQPKVTHTDNPTAKKLVQPTIKELLQPKVIQVPKIPPCPDVAPNKKRLCWQVASSGECGDKKIIKGKFCKKSCGRCPLNPFCTNIAPYDKKKTCYQRVAEGQCSEKWMIDGGYCKSACGRCGNLCTDINPNNKLSCWERSAKGQCIKKWMIDGGYCKSTCGRCGDLCTDINPNNDFKCWERAARGQCSDEWIIAGEYCKSSCSRCGNFCTDINFNNSMPCWERAAKGQCNDKEIIDGGYCKSSCGRCGNYCTNINPNNKLACWARAAKGECGKKWMRDGGYCKSACGRCGNSCTNINPNNKLTCWDRAAKGQCSKKWMIDGKFCQDSCHRCPLKHMADSTSFYMETTLDKKILSKTELLSKTISLSRKREVFIVSDGRYYPQKKGQANIYITVNGAKVSNDAFINWKRSTTPVQHSFNTAALVDLPAGNHSIKLIADHDGYTVGATSNLSVLVNPAIVSKVAKLNSISEVVDKDSDKDSNPGIVPMDQILTQSINSSGQDIVAIFSGTAQHVYDTSAYSGFFGKMYLGVRDVLELEKYFGDAMVGIYLNNTPQDYNKSSWSVNNISDGAEISAPLSSYAFFPAQGLQNVSHISLMAGEFPWKQGQQGSKQELRYHIMEGSSLFTFSGMTVAGRVLTKNSIGGAYSKLPPLNQPFELAKSIINIPSNGHNGIVMFLSKVRIQGGKGKGGKVSLWLEIDGKKVGSLGVQQLTSSNNVNHRTITTSYLATGDSALKVGNHEVSVMMKADGTFEHLRVHNDSPLIWFD